MAYPVPEMTANDTTNIFSLYKYVQHTATEGLFFPLLLFSIWIIAFIGSLTEGRQASLGFIFASFITSIISITLVFIGLLSASYMYFLFLMVGAGVIWMYLDRSPGI